MGGGAGKWGRTEGVREKGLLYQRLGRRKRSSWRGHRATSSGVQLHQAACAWARRYGRRGGRGMQPCSMHGCSSSMPGISSQPGQPCMPLHAPGSMLPAHEGTRAARLAALPQCLASATKGAAEGSGGLQSRRSVQVAVDSLSTTSKNGLHMHATPSS